MLQKVKKINLVLFLLILFSITSLTGVSVYSDWKNGEIRKDQILSELGSRVMLTGKANQLDLQQVNPNDSNENNINKEEIGIENEDLLQSSIELNSGELEFKKDQVELDAIKAQKEREEQGAKENKAQTNFSFIAFGEANAYNENGYKKELEEVLESAKDKQSDFFLFTGNLIDISGDKKTINKKINNLIALIKHYHNNYYFTFGKHELTCGAHCVAGWKRGLFDDSVSISQPGVMFHSFDYQNTHFVLLSTNWPSKNSIDEAQFQWLKKDLEGVDRNKIDNIIISQSTPPVTFFHKSSKECRDMSCDKKMQAKLLDLYKKNKVDLVLTGNEHTFKHKEFLGVDFVLPGSIGQSSLHEDALKGDIYSMIEVRGKSIILKSYKSKSGKIIQKINIK